MQLFVYFFGKSEKEYMETYISHYFKTDVLKIFHVFEHVQEEYEEGDRYKRQ